MAPNQNPNSNKPGKKAPTRTPFPVSRHTGYAPNARAPRIPTSDEERNQRIEALRHQLRYPHALTRSTLRYHLNRTNWDVNRAAQDFWEQEENPTLATPQPSYRRGNTVEQTRLRQVHDTQRGLERTAPTLRMANVELMLLHHDNNWVGEDVVEDIARRDGDFDDLIDRIANMRVPPDGRIEQDERLALFVSITSTNSWYSALAMLKKHYWDLAAAVDDWIRLGRLPIVTPPPIRSADGTLTQRDPLDGMRALNANRPRRILRGQFVYDDDNKDKKTGFKRKRSPGQDVESDNDSEIEWGPSPVLPETILPRPAKNQKRARKGEKKAAKAKGLRRIAGRDYVKTGRTGLSGFLIDADRTPAHVGAPDASKLRVEFIRKGKYRIRRFVGQFPVGRRYWPFRWDEKPGKRTTIEVEFDWNDPAHVSLLNRWRNNAMLQITGDRLRGEVGDNFNRYELDWLREQEAMRNEEKFYEWAHQDVNNANKTNLRMFASAVDIWSRAHSFPIPLSKAEAQDLTHRFNSTFAGQSFYRKTIVRADGTEEVRMKDMGRISKVPRPIRTLETIRQQRRRIKSLCKHFGTKYEYMARLEVEDPNELVSESDSDFAEDGGEESGGESDGVLSESESDSESESESEGQSESGVEGDSEDDEE